MTEISKIINTNNAVTTSAGKTVKTTSNSSSSTGGKTTATKELTIKSASGDTHSMVISEDGTVYDFNETDNTWAARAENGNIYTFKDSDADSKTTEKTVDLSEVDVEQMTVVSDTASDVKYNLADGSTLENYLKLNKMVSATESSPTSSSSHVVYVIDDFTNSLNPSGWSDTNILEADIGITHGDLVSAIITSGNDDDTDASNDTSVVKMDVGNNNCSYDSIAAQLRTAILDKVSGKQVDAVNISLGVATVLSDYGLDPTMLQNLDEAGRQQILDKLTQNGQDDLVLIITRLGQLSDLGVGVYLSSGNDADNVYGDNSDATAVAVKDSKDELYTKTGSYSAYYNDYKEADIDNDGIITKGEFFTYQDKYVDDENNDGIINSKDDYEHYKSYDSNKDGIVTGRELGVFNALSLAKGNNIHVISSTNSVTDTDYTDGVADYADDNSLVDAYYDGDVGISFIEGTVSSKTDTIIQYRDIKTIFGNFKVPCGTTTETTTSYGYDVDFDGKADLSGKQVISSEVSFWKYADGTYGYDIDGDGVMDINTAEEYSSDQIKNIAQNIFLEDGTSFSTPLALKMMLKNS